MIVTLVWRPAPVAGSGTRRWVDLDHILWDGHADQHKTAPRASNTPKTGLKRQNVPKIGRKHE
jgi:hypothetical protein